MADLVAAELRRSITVTMKRLSASSLMPASQGNLSARDADTGNVVITPHAYPYEDMTPDDLVVLAADGTQIDGRLDPSYDALLHLGVYAARPEACAVLHTEPPYVNAFGALNRAILPVTTTGLKSANGSIPIMPFRHRRDEAFVAEMLEIMGDRHGVVWQNHGLLVVADTVENAAERTIGIEFNAQVMHLALRAGEPQTLERVGADMIVA
ncbi:MAG: class II aldolase/adducin family protein [bacterium]|nr:class II aldolase/adducin family protein [bacterium]